MDLNLLLAKDPAELTVDEINFITNYAAKLRAVNKVAKEKGLIVAKAERVVSPEMILLADAFKVIISANTDMIQKLFDLTVDTEKPKGQKGINVTIEGVDFNVQILNKAAYKADAEAKKAEKVAAKAKKAEKADAEAEEAVGPTPEQVAAAEAARTGTL